MEKHNWKEVIKSNISLFIVVVIVTFVAGWIIHNKVDENDKTQNRYNYQSCINECYDSQMTNTQESICLNGCISKYK